MKRRTYQVTRFTKKVDHRLKKLELKLRKMNDLISYIEKNMDDRVEKSLKKETNEKVTYTISIK
ncbi:MAG: hypothetical protein HN729_12200 [Candidatus Marinimicrobia bacterium]|jgi:hypothetical protein|nr:hypothetical protein [Candidatus Neomarinimicrobiota bacterium]MBT3634264.1 hypothetical protein [Candidatus Neomarinimicrobiota bacterium]MBT3682937.1 hypothetical protein [Candidatus Neomarinimicrobiota bacterium]MBT3760073.1 hypothetical protein [Candidatus Neomarinimicrobiota bacterium]MBT3896160.1 hypothetical protein [Candidatus Neomarinimicrobiota bacterium]